MNSNTEIKPSATEPAETSEQQKSRMSPVMTEAYTQMLAAADEVEKVVIGVPVALSEMRYSVFANGSR